MVNFIKRNACEIAAVVLVVVLVVGGVVAIRNQTKLLNRGSALAPEGVTDWRFEDCRIIGVSADSSFLQDASGNIWQVKDLLPASANVLILLDGMDTPEKGDDVIFRLWIEQ